MENLKLLQFILKKYYVYSVALIAILLVSFGKYWLLTSILLYSTLLITAPEYIKDKCYYYYFLFHLDSRKNKLLKVIVKINMNMSVFLTCISFFLIDLFLFIIGFILNKKEKL